MRPDVQASGGAEQTTLLHTTPGARWLRCDLHVHTPFDGEKKFGEDVRGAIEAFKQEKPQRLAEIAERFIEACRNAGDGGGVDVVALTDHNSIEGYRRLAPQFETIAQLAGEQGRTMPVILPGVEFSIGSERPIHFLVVFASGTPPQDIEGVIRHVFGERDPFDPKTGTPRATGASIGDFLDRLYRYCRPPTGERNLRFVLLPAHADGERGVARETGGGRQGVATTLWDEMKGHLRQWAIARTDWNGFETSRPFEMLPKQFQELLLHWLAARRGEDWDALSLDRKQRYRQQRHWPLVECSDPHSYDQVGSRYSWLKMERPDVEGIRLALLDPESRLRRMADGPPSQTYPCILRMRVLGTDFFDDIELPFSPCLTTLIGGRGSGKSTVIEYLRYGLDRRHAEDFAGRDEERVRERVEGLLATKLLRDFGESEGTLLPDHAVEIDVAVATRVYRIRRSKDGIEVLPDPDAPRAEPAALDVRTLLQARILSQRQVAQIARDPAAQRRELDALLGQDRLRSFEERRSAIMEQLMTLQLARARLKERAASLPARETELRKINDQIAFLEEGRRKRTFEEYQSYQREGQWVDDVRRDLSTLAQTLEGQASAAETSAGGISLPPESGPNATWTTSVHTRVTEALRSTARELRARAAELKRLVTEMDQERQAQWLPRFEAARREYEALKEALDEKGVAFSQHEKLLQRQTALEREIRELGRVDDDQANTDRAIRDAREQLVRLHEERLEWRREQARGLEEADADVRLEIVPFRDQDDIEVKREEWFGGSGMRDEDWRVLKGFILSPGGSVPDRIEQLLAALRSDCEVTKTAGRSLTAASSAVVNLLGADRGSRLSGHFFNALQRHDRFRVDEMERYLPEDAIEARVRGVDGAFKPILQGSLGQRSTAMVSLLLSAGEQPLIIDQPEDDLDNQYIYDVVVDLLRKRKFTRQIIVATHNANIPVNGDAELILALAVRENERIGTVLARGSIDSPTVKDEVSLIMEGSAEAFRLRRERYGF